jgi:hypothetical protein
MMNLLEMVSEEIYKGFFVDLYVRCANTVAITMYEGMDYSVYRRVREYYGNLGVGKGGRDEEDAFGTSAVLQDSVIRLLCLKICENRWPGMLTANLFEQMGEISLSAHTMYHEFTDIITTTRHVFFEIT